MYCYMCISRLVAQRVLLLLFVLFILFLFSAVRFDVPLFVAVLTSEISVIFFLVTARFDRIELSRVKRCSGSVRFLINDVSVNLGVFELVRGTASKDCRC